MLFASGQRADDCGTKQCLQDFKSLLACRHDAEISDPDGKVLLCGFWSDQTVTLPKQICFPYDCCFTGLFKGEKSRALQLLVAHKVQKMQGGAPTAPTLSKFTWHRFYPHHTDQSGQRLPSTGVLNQVALLAT